MSGVNGNSLPTILVVEDFEDNRFMMRRLLEMSGYRVLEAVNGEEAVQLACHELPELILMDLSLPQLDGLAATRRSGASVCAASHQIANASSGAMYSIGATLRSAASAASRRRVCSGCATWITRSRVATPQGRQPCPWPWMSAKPRSAPSGRLGCPRHA